MYMKALTSLYISSVHCLTHAPPDLFGVVCGHPSLAGAEELSALLVAGMINEASYIH